MGRLDPRWRAADQLSDENAERVTGRVGEHVQRLILVIAAVEQFSGTKSKCPIPLDLQVLARRHDRVQVEHLRHGRVWPSRGPDAVGLLERQLWSTVRVLQHEPVTTARVVLVGRRQFITGAILQPEQLAVELSQRPRIGRIDHDLSNPWIRVSHALMLSLSSDTAAAPGLTCRATASGRGGGIAAPHRRATTRFAAAAAYLATFQRPAAASVSRHTSAQAAPSTLTPDFLMLIHGAQTSIVSMSNPTQRVIGDPGSVPVQRRRPELRPVCGDCFDNRPAGYAKHV